MILYSLELREWRKLTTIYVIVFPSSAKVQFDGWEGVTAHKIGKLKEEKSNQNINVKMKCAREQPIGL